MELKVLCDCGQKYAFDVEPVAGQMPIYVNCPSCGKDGTQTANALLAEQAETPGAQTQPQTTRLRVSVSQPAAQPTVFVPSAPPPPLAAAPAASFGPAKRDWEKMDMTERHSLGLGFLGSIMGAALGVGIMFGCEYGVGLVMPIFGLIIGLLSGFGARWLYKGTDITLGVIAAVVTLFATGVTFLMLFGLGAIMCIMMLVITVGIAFKVAG